MNPWNNPMFKGGFFDIPDLTNIGSIFLNKEKTISVGQQVKVVDAAGNDIDEGVVISIDDELIEVEVKKVITVRRSDIK